MKYSSNLNQMNFIQRSSVRYLDSGITFPLIIVSKTYLENGVRFKRAMDEKLYILLFPNLRDQFSLLYFESNVFWF